MARQCASLNWSFPVSGIALCLYGDRFAGVWSASQVGEHKSTGNRHLRDTVARSDAVLVSMTCLRRSADLSKAKQKTDGANID